MERASRSIAEVVADLASRTPEPSGTWEAERAREDAERLAAERRAKVMALDLPVTLADERALLDGTTEKTRIATAVNAWFAGPDPLLVLSGTPGTGKTMASAVLLVEHGGAYVRALELARLYLAQFGEEIERREALAATYPLLVVDDIGTERDAASMTVALVEVLDARRRGRRNIWCTNLSRAAFEARYPDPRLHSRMAQSGSWLVEAGEDLRR